MILPLSTIYTLVVTISSTPILILGIQWLAPHKAKWNQYREMIDDNLSNTDLERKHTEEMFMAIVMWNEVVAKAQSTVILTTGH